MINTEALTCSTWKDFGLIESGESLLRGLLNNLPISSSPNEERKEDWSWESAEKF